MEIWEVLKREMPTSADEINLAIQNCIDTIENARVLLSNKSKSYIDLQKTQEAIEMVQVTEELLNIKSYMENIKCEDVSALEETQEMLINNNIKLIEETASDEEIDDNIKYLVDQTIPYKLSEDFTYTAPCDFMLQGEKYSASSFKELLVKLCEVLYRGDQCLFEKIAREHKIKCGENGGVMIFFKQDRVASELPENKCTHILSSGILIYTNTNTNTKILAIKKLLSIYKISEKSFSIYLRWDKRITKGLRPTGKLINIDYDYSQHADTQTKVKPEIGVKQLAYNFFKEYFKDKQKHYDLRDFLDEVWCMDKLGITRPLFKEIIPHKHLKKQIKWKEESFPSYDQDVKFQINGKKYLICKSWYEQHRHKLESWINEQDSTYLENVYSKIKIGDQKDVLADAVEENYRKETGEKIGKQAREYFTKYFSNVEKEYDLSNFLDKCWCKEHLGIYYPLLKEVDNTKSIADQRNYDNEHAYYWIKPVLQVNGKYYIMCSQWYGKFQEKLENWIEKEKLREVTEFKQQSLFPNMFQRNKKDCVHYDFKKDQCMCTQSEATFTLSCSNISSCHHFTPFALHIIPKQYCKKKHCPYCNESLVSEWVLCTYSPKGKKEKQHKLNSYRCNKCEISYMQDAEYTQYTSNKNINDLNVVFIKEDLA